MKKLLLALCGLLVIVSAPVHAATESLYNARIWAVPGYVRANTNAFEQWSTNLLSELLLTDGFSNKFGHALASTNVMQPTSTPTNMGIWYIAHIAAKSPAHRFRLSNMKAVIRTSDPGNILRSTNELNAANVTFTKRVIGIQWNGAPRSADRILDSQGDGNLADVDVDEAMVLMIQSKYFNHASQEDRDAINAFIYGFPNWQETCTIALNGDGGVLASAVKTLETKRTPLLPIINLTANATDVTIGLNLEGLNSVLLYTRPKVTAKWQLLSTGNAGDTFTRPAGDQGYYQAFLQ